MPYHDDEPKSPPPTKTGSKLADKRASTKMTDQQKAQLNKHMAKHKKQGMTASEMKSHRMKMMSRMRRGLSVNAAHKDIMKSESSE